MLLRGINVGGLKLSMADLKAMALQLGYQTPDTILNTGNLLIQSTQAPQEIKAALDTALSTFMGQPMHCLVRSLEQLELLLEEAKASPIPGGMHHYILFCDAPLHQPLAERYQAYEHRAGEGLFATGQDVHWRVRKGETLAGFGSQVLGASQFRAQLTSRNLNTVERIAIKLRAM